MQPAQPMPPAGSLRPLPDIPKNAGKNSSNLRMERFLQNVPKLTSLPLTAQNSTFSLPNINPPKNYPKIPVLSPPPFLPSKGAPNPSKMDPTWQTASVVSHQKPKQQAQKLSKQLS